MLITNPCICSLKLYKGWLWKTDMKKNIKRINMGILTVLLCLTLHMKEKNLHSQTNSYHFAILVKQEGNFSAVSATRTGHFCTYKCQTSCRAQAILGVVQNILPSQEPWRMIAHMAQAFHFLPLPHSLQVLNKAHNRHILQVLLEASRTRSWGNIQELIMWWIIVWSQSEMMSLCRRCWKYQNLQQHSPGQRGDGIRQREQNSIRQIS